MIAGALAGYEDFAHADVLASSDCLSPVLDVKDDGCFHVLQDRNTGVLLVRNTSAARGAMLESLTSAMARRLARQPCTT